MKPIAVTAIITGNFRVFILRVDGKPFVTIMAAPFPEPTSRTK